MTRIIPVLDLMGGIVVRGVGGRRSEYRPLVSKLTDSVEPVAVARALVEACKPDELYLADLDALAGAPPAVGVYRAIRDLGVRVWVDAGVRDVDSARRLVDAGCDVVAGLETVERSALPAILAMGAIFSLDLRDGVPLRPWADDARGVAAIAAEAGATRMIVLDLARVGVSAGIGTEQLCRDLAVAHPDVEIIAGGGVRDASDLARLGSLGVRGALVASALHDGRLP